MIRKKKNSELKKRDIAHGNYEIMRKMDDEGEQKKRRYHTQ